MNRTLLAPMGAGELLDRSFVVYRQRFRAFFLMALLLLGPFLLLQDLLVLDLAGLPFVVQISERSGLWEAISRLAEAESRPIDLLGFQLLNLLVVMPVMTLGAYPQLLSGTLLLTKAVLEGRELGIKGALRQAVGRFCPLAGATFVFALIIIGLALVVALVFVLLFLLVSLAFGDIIEAAFNDRDSMGFISFLFLFLTVYVLFLLAVMSVPGFFMLRWGFYLPFTLLEGDGVALGKSWALTRGSSWRLLGLYLALLALGTVLSGGIQMLLIATMGISILSQLITLLLSCLLTPWMMIVYSLAYFDLRVRNEPPSQSAQMAEVTQQ